MFIDSLGGGIPKAVEALVRLGGIMKTRMLTILMLTIVWILLREDFSIFTVVTGIVLGFGCAYMFGKYLPAPKVSGISVFRLLSYPFYLIWQVYLSGFVVIGIILTQAKTDIVQITTSLKNDVLRAILAHSITLTPGSISLDLKDEVITLLWLRKKSAPDDTGDAGDFLKGQLEKKLKKAEKS